MLVSLDVAACSCVVPVERRYGGDPRISVSAPDGRHHDAEVDAQSADERLGGRSGIREEVQLVKP